MDRHLVIQDALCGGVDPEPAAIARGWRLHRVGGSLREVERRLAEVEREIEPGDKALVFCALHVAARLQARGGRLARSVFLDRDFLRHHRWTAVVPRRVQLNPEGVYLPFGRLADWSERLQRLCGERLFVRPDSCMKPFAGFAIEAERLPGECAALDQAERVDPAELCYVAPAIRLPPEEFRFWLVDGRVAACAPYGWVEPDPRLRPPPRIRAAAEDLAHELEIHDNMLVADFVALEGEPRLIELNALSTSGFHPGMSLEALLGACDELLV